jgi:Phage regulatory protein Rha (Phage_pRha)
MSFIQPYSIQQLGDELGLTSEDVAKALGTNHRNVIESIQTISSIIPGFAVKTALLKNEKGRPTKLFLLTTDEAKLVTARYGNDLGLGYLKFLIECEKVATELMPKMAARIRELEEEIGFLRSRKQALPEGKGPSKVLIRELVSNVLPGFQPFFVNRYVSPEEAVQFSQSLELAKLAHLKKVKQGVDAKYIKQENFVLGGVN